MVTKTPLHTKMQEHCKMTVRTHPLIHPFPNIFSVQQLSLAFANSPQSPFGFVPISPASTLMSVRNSMKSLIPPPPNDCKFIVAGKIVDEESEEMMLAVNCLPVLLLENSSTPAKTPEELQAELVEAKKTIQQLQAQLLVKTNLEKELRAQLQVQQNLIDHLKAELAKHT